ncbi:hypothetical protein AM1_C0084 (plasmid) [Acaryochloris marina MBIC11017]|uniref:Uncharacterized protein n=1 Tax=Acaryochloris marina (strain MBIC 11017) TaxID=329726 RepID=A8ZMI1_ACAM1|nr:hypothetical protein AM1_C0084 [Acaryochloris marina MBIC11017]
MNFWADLWGGKDFFADHVVTSQALVKEPVISADLEGFWGR